MLLNGPFVADAKRLAQKTGQWISNFGPSSHFDQADKNAGRFGSRQILHQPASSSRSKRGGQTAKRQQAADDWEIDVQRVVHWLINSGAIVPVEYLEETARSN